MSLHRRQTAPRYGSGYYEYETHGAGLCCYKTKRAAIRNARLAAEAERICVDVYAPSGRLVETVRPTVPTVDEIPDWYGDERDEPL
jgi:hypothetical protein